MTDGEKEKWVGISTFKLFDIKLSDHVLTYEESKGWALQGTYVYKEALAGSRYGYPDFYAKCIEEYNQATTTETVNGATVKVNANGHKFYNISDKTAIDEFFNSVGSAWFYGVDIENERIFLPRNNWFEQATGNTSEVGQSIEAGLPNIKGVQPLLYAVVASTHSTTSALYSDSSVESTSAAGSNASGNSMGFDASKSNPIYKDDCDTVQPPAVKKLLYICVGNTTNYEGLTDVVNQGMEILEQVNQGIESRVSKDSLVEVPCITETYVNGTSWYRIWSDGWCEQGGRASVNRDSTTEVSFLKSFKDTNYYANWMSCDVAITSGGGVFGIISLTTTSMLLSNGADGNVTANWQASGYIW